MATRPPLRLATFFVQPFAGTAQVAFADSTSCVSIIDGSDRVLIGKNALPSRVTPASAAACDKRVRRGIFVAQHVILGGADAWDEENALVGDNIGNGCAKQRAQSMVETTDYCAKSILRADPNKQDYVC